MKMIVEMPPVSSCNAAACAYNVDRQCHAKAVTIGNSASPSCDTFFDSGKHTINETGRAGVGACKTADCIANEDYECSAEGVTIGLVNGNVRCLTYRKRTTN